MNLVEFAREELERAGLFKEDSDPYGGEIGKAVMEIVDVFSKQGHSGFSSSIVLSILDRVLRFKPLTPLTFEDDEWTEVAEVEGQPLFQNKRDPSCFKKGKEGTPYFVE